MKKALIIIVGIVVFLFVGIIACTPDTETTAETTTTTTKPTTTTTKPTTTKPTTTKLTTTTTKPTTTTTRPTTTQPPTTAPKSGIVVYTTPYGEKYHLDPECGGKNSRPCDLDDVRRTYEPCKKCAQ